MTASSMSSQSARNVMIVETNSIKKTYQKHLPLSKRVRSPFSKQQRVTALDSVSICIESGQILGLVGSNGAGKTTLLRILADLLEPDLGTVSICGKPLAQRDARIRRKIGYVSSDERSFFWRLTGKENLEFFARLYGCSVGQSRKRTACLIEEFNFEDKADQLFRDYSAGMRKKTAVMRALLHEPSLLLLDEATNSLDWVSAETVKGIVRRYVSDQKGRAAVWSTHRLEEVSQICDKVATIDSGRIISKDYVEDSVACLDYMLRLENLNGQLETFCRTAGCCAKTRKAKDNTDELFLSGITRRQFSRIVSMAVKDFGAYVVFAGCVQKGPDTMSQDL